MIILRACRILCLRAILARTPDDDDVLPFFVLLPFILFELASDVRRFELVRPLSSSVEFCLTIRGTSS